MKEIKTAKKMSRTTINRCISQFSNHTKLFFLPPLNHL